MNEKRQNLLRQIGVIKTEDQLSLNDWEKISVEKSLSEEFIGVFKDKVNWLSISLFQNLSEQFISDFEDFVIWKYISNGQMLSEDFIREHQNILNWSYITEKQKLSNEFLHEFQHRIDWEWISQFFKLTDDFLCEFEHKIDWDIYFHYQEANFQIIKKFIFRTRFRNIKSFKISHLNDNQKNDIENKLKLKYIFIT